MATPGKQYSDELNHQQVNSLIDELKGMGNRSHWRQLRNDMD
jgi:hypothetical protein